MQHDNVIAFRAPIPRRGGSSLRSAPFSDLDCLIHACIDDQLAEFAPAVSTFGEASIIAFPGHKRRAPSPERKKRLEDDEWYRAFGRALLEARIKAGVSIEEAAAAAGRTVETWHHYETTGRGRLTYPLLRFAKHCGISLDDLFDRASASLSRPAD